MPEGGDPGALLRGGEFYSPVKARLLTDEVLFSELRPSRSCHFPRHHHELSYVTVILGGDYREGDCGRMQELQPLTAVFNPSGIEHATEIGPAGALAFTIELRQEHLRRLELRLPLQTKFDRGGGALLWPGLRLYAAFKTNTMDPLVRESYLLEMLAAVAGFSAFEKSKPRWLIRVKERMQEELGENLRMRDLADSAGVHPVHLARVFREHEGRTPGDYLQQLRVRAACRRMRDQDYPLAIIAAECGFADQSHFTRVFRKFTGNAPAKFRRALESGSTAAA
jgi:AraC family transcriptional regulator